MEAMDSYLGILLAYLLFWTVIYIVSKVFKTERYGFAAGPLYFIYRTVRFNGLLRKIASRGRMWRVVWNIGVAVGFGQICFILLTLLRNIVLLMSKSSQAAPIMVLIPGITISSESLPYILFSLIVVVVTHEVAHGVASVVEGIPLKSSGMFFAVVMPGAFVEPDEETLQRADEVKQLRIYSAGSFSNIVFGILSIVLIVNFAATISPFFNTAPGGILITGVAEAGAAEGVGLRRWDVIYAINTTEIDSVEGLMKYMVKVTPGSYIKVDSDRGEFMVKTQPNISNSSRAMIGISPFNFYAPKTTLFPKSAPYHLYMTEYWLNALLIGIALINMLPLHPFDGGRYVHSLLKMAKFSRSEEIRNVISIFALTVLALNILLTFMTFGLRKV